MNGFADPFEDNDDDVNRIAKEFERKYGTTCAGKKRSSNNNDCDKGAGYDLNDVFIDNSEAVSDFRLFPFHVLCNLNFFIALQYDELIPDEIETDRGGFYINSGALEFKNLPNYERPDDAARMPKPKKVGRIIEKTSVQTHDLLFVSCSVRCQFHRTVVHLAMRSPIKNKIQLKTDPMKRNQNFPRKTNIKTKRRS